MKWFNEFKKLDCKGLKLSSRGRHHRKDRFDAIQIGDSSIESMFEIYLATVEHITVDNSKIWLENLISNYFPVGHPVRDINISRDWVYHTIGRLGGKYEERKKHYYTDNHEAESTVTYRNNSYIPAVSTKSTTKRMGCYTI